MSGRRHPNLVGWWMMDGNLLDWSGEGNHGTVGAGSAAYAPGVFGRGYDAQNSVGSVAATTTPNYSQILTIAFWIRFQDADATGRFIGENNWHRGGVFFWGGNRVGFFNWGDGTQEELNFGNVVGSSWTHIAMTRSGVDAGANVRIYANSSLVADHTAVRPSIGSGADFRISNARSNRVFTSDIRIYNAALSPSDIMRVYRGQQPARVYA